MTPRQAVWTPEGLQELERRTRRLMPVWQAEAWVRRNRRLVLWCTAWFLAGSAVVLILRGGAHPAPCVPSRLGIHTCKNVAG